MTSFVTHLSCSMTGEQYPAGEVHGLSKAGRPLLVHYDLEKVAAALTKDMLASRRDGFWRYAALLPVSRAENRVSLGEVVTPLVETPNAARRAGHKARSSSRTKAACRPARSRRAASPSPYPWRRS